MVQPLEGNGQGPLVDIESRVVLPCPRASTSSEGTPASRARCRAALRSTDEDLDDVYFARSAIERASMVRISERGLAASDMASLEQTLGQMAVAIKAEDWRAVAAADLRFHEIIVNAAGSPRLSRMYAALSGESRLGLNLLVGTFQGRTDYLDEHTRIFNFLAAGDRNNLVNELEKHLGTALNTLHSHHPHNGAVTSPAMSSSLPDDPGGSSD